MYFETADGVRLHLDAPFVIDGVQYPANWLRMTSIEEKNAVGIVEKAEETILDTNLSSLFRLADGTPRDLEAVKGRMLKECRTRCYNELAKTDWMVVRAAEGVAPIPEDVVAMRKMCRDECNEREIAINSATVIEDLEALA